MKKWSYLIFVIVISGFWSCNKDDNNCEKGKGDRFEDIRYFENFHTFKLDIPGQIILTPDTLLKSSRIVILGQENVIKQIITTISEGTVGVKFNQCFNNHDDIQFHIYTPYLKKLITNTAARVKSTSALYGTDFTLELNSGSTVDLTCSIDSITTFMNSASEVDLFGYSSRQVVSQNSSGSYRASELISDSTIVDVPGQGYVNVYSTGHFIANVSGSGKVEFSGEDSLHITTNITGTGTITDLR